MEIWKAAELRAHEVRSALAYHGKPFSLKHAIQLFDINILYDATLMEDYGYHGVLIQYPYRDPRMYINTAVGYREQRFLIAHMLGHVIQHTAETPSAEYSYIEQPKQTYTLNEYYADAFARALLLPYHEVAIFTPDFEKHHALEIALSFDMPIDETSRRVQHLHQHHADIEALLPSSEAP